MKQFWRWRPEFQPTDADVGELAIARERELSKHIGAGVAIPHARCRGLSEPIVVFAHSEVGVEFFGQTPGVANLLFLLVTPAEQPDAQIFLLSQIASVAGDVDKRQRLTEATSPSAVAGIITITKEEKSVRSNDA